VLGFIYLKPLIEFGKGNFESVFGDYLFDYGGIDLKGLLQIAEEYA
jgi:hypothetical protein